MEPCFRLVSEEKKTSTAPRIVSVSLSRNFNSESSNSFCFQKLHQTHRLPQFHQLGYNIGSLLIAAKISLLGQNPLVFEVSASMNPDFSQNQPPDQYQKVYPNNTPYELGEFKDPGMHNHNQGYLRDQAHKGIVGSNPVNPSSMGMGTVTNLPNLPYNYDISSQPQVSQTGPGQPIPVLNHPSQQIQNLHQNQQISSQNHQQVQSHQQIQNLQHQLNLQNQQVQNQLNPQNHQIQNPNHQIQNPNHQLYGEPLTQHHIQHHQHLHQHQHQHPQHHHNTQPGPNQALHVPTQHFLPNNVPIQPPEALHNDQYQQLQAPQPKQPFQPRQQNDFPLRNGFHEHDVELLKQLLPVGEKHKWKHVAKKINQHFQNSSEASSITNGNGTSSNSDTTSSSLSLVGTTGPSGTLSSLDSEEDVVNGTSAASQGRKSVSATFVIRQYQHMLGLPRNQSTFGDLASSLPYAVAEKGWDELDESELHEFAEDE